MVMILKSIPTSNNSIQLSIIIEQLSTLTAFIISYYFKPTIFTNYIRRVILTLSFKNDLKKKYYLIIIVHEHICE